MSEISESIQAKCLTFGDRVIKLNDYLLKEVSQKGKLQQEGCDNILFYWL